MRLQASVLPGLVAGVYRERLFEFAQTGGRFPVDLKALHHSKPTTHDGRMWRNQQSLCLGSD